jgi:predicted enzyme related to lactoylglutathione lyase
MKTKSESISITKVNSGICFTPAVLNSALLVSAVFAFIILSGCGTFQLARLPPVTSGSDAKLNVGKFVWIDLLTEDTGTASVFYEALFGWHTAPSKGDETYYVFSLDDNPVAGMSAADNNDSEVPESWWLISLSVDDVDQSVAVVKEHGGKLLEGPVDDAGRGRMALVSDPGGAPLILLRAAGGDPADEKAAIGTWFWTDLFTRDAKAAEAFYHTLVGFQKKQLEAGEDHRYLMFKQNSKARAGIVELQWDDLKDNWMPYVMVDDIKSTINTARELGGNLILEKGDVAVLVDPTGAVFGIQAHR